MVYNVRCGHNIHLTCFREKIVRNSSDIDENTTKAALHQFRYSTNYRASLEGATRVDRVQRASAHAWWIVGFLNDSSELMNYENQQKATQPEASGSLLG